MSLRDAVKVNRKRFGKDSGTVAQVIRMFKKEAEVRKRKNKEACPRCASRDVVYRWKNSYLQDGRWFCFCGYAEVPDTGSSLESWREGLPEAMLRTWPYTQ